jgi:hypothetical protein
MDQPVPPPVFHANIATIRVNAEQVTVEFRDIDMEHSDAWRRSEKGTKPIPPLTDDEIYAIPPVARVVMTYTAAKYLQANLNTLMPQVEEWRKQAVAGLPEAPKR